MGKKLFIAEKPSVAQAFAKALHENTTRKDGYVEGEHIVVTWCVGHLVTMSYPEVYDIKYKKWRLDTLPFIPKEFKYEVIPASAKQYKIVASLLNREDVDTIYVCTDSGREGEYIYRLVAQEAGVHDKIQKRVWIDSQTEEEIRRGIREAKDESAYDNLAASAYLRAKEDYLMGINFSRLLSLKYGNAMASFLNERYCVISIGRVMTCVLGMVVRREREIRNFVKTPFYRVLSDVSFAPEGEKADISGLEWRAVTGSRYKDSPLLYKENGFKERKDAVHLIEEMTGQQQDTLPEDAEAYNCSVNGTVHTITRKKEKKNPPLLYNLAEIQNDCSRFFKISPDETLNVIQELYEKKLVTYPRTDARVLSTAVAKEIDKNIRGLTAIPGVRPFAQRILEEGRYKGIAKTRYTDDSKITDHYALIPTGQGMGALNHLTRRSMLVYEIIVRRFLAIFMDPAVYDKLNLTVKAQGEYFFTSDKYLAEEGYLEAMHYSFQKSQSGNGSKGETQGTNDDSGNASDGANNEDNNIMLAEVISSLKKGDPVRIVNFGIREGETSPPKRYNSGSMILAMENAGQLIEDEELRAQIKSQGIGTSATRAEILNKLVRNRYLALNKKTQIITPTLQGEMIFDIVSHSMPQMLNPELTASWEKGLNYVAEGTINEDEYMKKLEGFIRRRTSYVLKLNNQNSLNGEFREVASYYPAWTNTRYKTKSAGHSSKGRASRGGKSASGNAGRSGKTASKNRRIEYNNEQLLN